MRCGQVIAMFIFVVYTFAGSKSNFSLLLSGKIKMLPESTVVGLWSLDWGFK